MIEKIICDYLSEKLGVTCLPEMPERPFGTMVFVERTGGHGRFLRESTLVIKSYADSLYKAASLNEQVIEAMWEAPELSEITKVTLNSNYNYTDVTTKEYRYQAVFDVFHY